MPEPDFKQKKVIGIIGYGRFGKFSAQILSEKVGDDFTIAVFSRHKIVEKNSHIQFLSIEKINTADIIIPCVPISIFEETILSIAPHLKPGSLVMDVCSVKVFPIEIMEKVLPAHIQIIGSHPVFGPDSYVKNGGLDNLPIVLTKVRCAKKTYNKVKHICKLLKLQVLEMTAEQHDQFAAYSQAYAFLIGKISQRMNIQPTPIDTMWYKLLIEEKAMIERDSEELFLDIQTKNQFTPKMRIEFSSAVEKVLKEIYEAHH